MLSPTLLTLTHRALIRLPTVAANKTALTTWHILAAGAVAGPVLFTLAWIVLGILQPPVVLRCAVSWAESRER